MANTTFDKKRIGSIWAKTSKAGKPYLTGVIEVDGKEINFLAFSNKNPNGPTSPAHFVYESDPFTKGEAKPAAAAAPAAAPASKPKAAKAKSVTPAAVPAEPAEEETPL